MPSPSHAQHDLWFTEHVQPHESILRRWLARRFDAHVDIDDIIQETYLRILRTRQAGVVPAPKAFLFVTARNLALDRLRSHQLSRTDSLEDFDALALPDRGDDAPEALARSQELALLAEAIQALPARCREILTLRKLHGLSHREIAAHLGLSESTVSNQITIGIEKCTEFFERHGDGDLHPR